MIEVELPDGTIAEFPDGTAPEVIKGALQKRFGAPAPDVAAPAMPPSEEYQQALAGMSAATQNPARGQYDQLPGWQKPLVAASDTAQLVASGAGMGFLEKGVAAARAPFTGQSYEQELEAQRALTEGARNRAGGAGTAAEITGAVGTGLGLAQNGVTLAGRLGTNAMTGIPGLLARTGLMGVEGAGYGAATAAGNDQDISIGALTGLLAGGAGNVAGEAIANGVSKVAGAFNKAPSIPSRDSLNAAKNAAYDAAENAGVAYTPQAMQRIGRKVITELTDIGFDPALQPGAAAAVRRIQELAGQNVTLKGLDTIRKVASNGFIPGNKSNNLAISKIVDTIDDLIENPQASDILMGNGAAGAAAIKEARSLASRVAKLDKVEDALSRADLRAASTGSGGNADNATRQNILRLLEKPRGLSPDERAAMDQVVRGTSGQNALRLAGKLSPSGNGLMAALGVGGAMVNPMIGAASLGGMGAKAIADRMTKAKVQELANIIAAGGSIAATRSPKNAAQLLAESKREAIARLLMGLAVNQAVAP